MDNEKINLFTPKESTDIQQKNSKDNTEYAPTRCRITKPIPPKPATNPMQFVKIGPCELYRKAQEQLKKVEEVKSVRQEIRDDAEDWQANLDNWKSSRRKRQEHIIERVVEVKKYEQQEMEKGRKKSKTFSEILEEKNKRKNKLNISIYDDDNPNDLSDYGIYGLSDDCSTSKSETNTVHSESELPKEKCNMNDNICTIETHEQDLKSKSEQSIIGTLVEETMKENHNCLHELSTTNNTGKLPKIFNYNDSCEKIDEICREEKKDTDNENVQEEPTYESAIQSYRTRVISKTNLTCLPFTSKNNNKDDEDDNIATANTNNDVDVLISKGSILKRKELFEKDKLYELNHFESNTSRRLSEDFINSQSLKERLLSLEKYTDQSLNQLSNVTYSSTDVKNNNTSKPNSDKFVRNRITVINHLNDSKDDEFEVQTKSKSVICDSLSNKQYKNSDNTDFLNQLETKQIHRSLDNITELTNESLTIERVQSLDGLEYCHSNYPASNSSNELLLYGDTDREDSGIHTADVSCSVSQADEPVDDVITEEEPKRRASENTISPLMQFDGVFINEDFPLGAPITALEPPKEKPPPPPMTDIDANDLSDESELKRINSTKRLKNEMRMKRSSFLGIDPDIDDQPGLEASIRKPPDISSFLQKETRLEKQLYKKSQLQANLPTRSNYSETGDSQDSGIELERGRLSTDTWYGSLTHTHNRQDSEQCTTNSITSEEDEITKKEREIIELVEKEEQWRNNDFPACTSGLPLIEQTQQINDRKEVHTDFTTSDDEHSEVLRVEHELLQLEREERERQRENILYKENRKSKLCSKNKGVSLEDISGIANQPQGYMSKCAVDYRKSMPELQREINLNTNSRFPHFSISPHGSSRTPVREPIESEFYPSPTKCHPVNRYPVQMHSVTPRTRSLSQDNWLQSQSKLSLSDTKEKTNYNQHWLIQEAEQRRLSAQSTSKWNLSRSEKHLPDSIIQTLTQRVQNKMNIPERNFLIRKMPHSPHSVGHALPIHHPHFAVEDTRDKILSVSGKKKCSYCGNELGRGAAMIIESLCLFYHMDCFKCCVCHVQLGDGLMGTDVRVRNNKLHCHNCYSSDDGVKFSCV